MNLQKADRELLRAFAHRAISTGFIILCLITPHSLSANDRPNENISTPADEKLVFFGFQPVLDPGEGVLTVQSPLSGAVFEAEPVEGKIAQDLTEDLYKRLIQKKDRHVISPDQARGIFSVIIERAPASTDRQIMPQIGRAFSAKAVLAGYVYRWRERRGSGLAVDSPASVAFDLCLIDSDTTKLLWKGRFDKTQRSLSENIFEFRIFLEGKGKWMTAKELANIGLRQLMDKFEQYEIEAER